jgi:hypothetical protein
MNEIINFLSSPVPSYTVTLLGLVGLVASTHGTIKLITPLIKSTKKINDLAMGSSDWHKSDDGAFRGINPIIVKEYKKDRHVAFEGAWYLSSGFMLQFLNKLIDLLNYKNSINYFLFMVIIVAIFIFYTTIAKNMIGKKEKI